MRLKKQNYFVKLLIYFILLAISSTSVIFGYTTYKSNDSVRSLLLDTNTKVLSNTVHSFENKMQQVFDNIVLFICQQDTYVFLNNEDYKSLESKYGPFDESELKLLPQYIYSKKYFFQTLEGFQKSYDFIDTFYVYDSRSDILYSSDGSISSSNFYYDNSWHQFLKTSETFPVIIEKRIKHRDKANNEGIEVMTMIYKNSDIFFVVNFDYRLLFDSSLRTISNTNTKSLFFILNKDKEIIVNNTEANQFDLAAISSRISDAGNLSLIEIKDDQGKRFFAICLSSSLMNWTFIEAVPASFISGEVNRIFYISSLIFLILLIVISFVSLFLSKTAYRPIRGIMELVNATTLNNGNEEKHTDIEIIHDSILTLSNEKNNLLKTFEQVLPALKVKFFYDLLTGHIRDKNSLYGMFDHLGMRLPLNDYYAVVIEINILAKQISGYSETDNGILMKLITNKLKFMFNNGLSGFFAELKDNEIGIAINGFANDFSALINILKNFNKEISLQNELSISIGVGDHTDDSMLIKKSLDQARAANKYKLTFGGNQVICHADIADIKDKKTDSDSFTEMTEHFTNFLSSGLAGKAEAELMNIIDHISEKRFEISYESAVDIYISLMNEVYKISAKKSEPYDIGGMLDRNFVFNATKHEMFLFFKKIIVAYCENHSNMLNKSKIDRLLLNIETYISENYASDISLDIIAAKAGLNSAYLCRVFKKSTGTNLVRYIEQIRIKKAKEMLKESDIKIFEVSEKVGYINPNYFSKVFKKHTGLTPGEFKEMR